MILYSILPVYTPEEEEPVYVELSYKGHHVLACQTDQGYILERVYSTNPTDYTAIDLIPGSQLEDHLVNKIIQ